MTIYMCTPGLKSEDAKNCSNPGWYRQYDPQLQALEKEVVWLQHKSNKAFS